MGRGERESVLGSRRNERGNEEIERRRRNKKMGGGCMSVKAKAK